MVNLQKSELATNCEHASLTHSLASLINCQPTSFPIKYLGLPLSEKRLARSDYDPLIEKIRLKLSGWKASLLSIGGRAILTNAVLSAIPQYYMSVFLLPEWLLRKIDQLRRRFFWHGHKEQHRQLKGMYMVNWKIATKPRQQGGLGIRDVRLANRALLIKWMWQWCDCNNTWWKQATPTINATDKPWYSQQPSPFWKSFKDLIPIFECSLRFKLGDGNTIQFWHDNWSDKPLKHEYPNLYQAMLYKHHPISHYRNETNWILQHEPLNSLALFEK